MRVVHVPPGRVAVGDELVTDAGTAFVVDVGYADVVQRAGWRFAMGDGGEVVRHHNVNDVALVVRGLG